jgi:cytochrome c oxidase assembly protein subunit 15
LRGLAASSGLLAASQIALGITTLRLQLAQPAVTVGHQLTAALLIAVLGALFGRSMPERSSPSACPSRPTIPEVCHG